MSGHNPKVMDLADQIQRLGTNQRTGTLVISSTTGKKKYIYFGGGKIEMISIPRKQYLLGEALFKIGKIDREQLLKMIHERFKQDDLLGNILMEKGGVTQEDLLEAIQFQVQEEICDLFTWGELEFNFLEGEPDPEKFSDSLLNSKVAMNSEMLVIEAARRIDEWEIIKDTIPSFMDVYKQLFDDTSQLDDSMKMVYENINGRNTVEDVLERTRLDRYSSLHLMSLLKQGGYIEALDFDALVELVKTDEEMFLERKREILDYVIDSGFEKPEAYMQLAEIHEELEDKEKCAQTYISYGEYALKHEDPEQAEYAYNMSVDLFPDGTEGYEKLSEFLISADRQEDGLRALLKGADHFFVQEDFEQAKAFWEKVTQIDPEFVDGHLGLGRYYEHKKEPAQANIEFGQAADILLEQGKKEEAVGLYRHMLTVDKDCMEAGLNLARTLGEMGKTEEAVSEYQNLAVSLSSAGVIDDMVNWAFLVKVYENIVELDPQNISAREWLSKGYIEKNNNDKALPHLEALLGIYQDQKEFAKCEPVLENLVILKPEDVDVRITYAENKMSLGKRDDAVEILAGGGRFFQNKGNEEAASRLFGKALEFDPFNIDARESMAYLMLDQGNKEDACLLFVLTAKVCRGAEHDDAAVRNLVSALEIDSSNITALRELAELFFAGTQADIPLNYLESFIEIQKERKNYGEAFDMLQAMMDKEPEKPEYKEQLSGIWKVMNAPEDAPAPAPAAPASETPPPPEPEPAPVPEKAPQPEPEPPKEEIPEITPEEAIKALKQVVKMRPKDIASREKLADMYRKQGDVLSTAAILREVAALYKEQNNNAKSAAAEKEADEIMKKLGITKPASSIKKVAKPAPAKKPPKKKPEKKNEPDDDNYTPPMSLDDFEKGLK